MRPSVSVTTLRALSMTLVSLMDITGHFDDQGFPATDWQFFDTEEELRQYVAWMEESIVDGEKTSNVIHLHK